MSTLRKFSEKERDYHAYQARQNFIREQNTIQWEREQALKEKDEALKEKDEALKEKDEALKEKDEALKEKDEALKEKDEALGIALREKREKDEALSEIERLKALLANGAADLH